MQAIGQRTSVNIWHSPDIPGTPGPSHTGAIEHRVLRAELMSHFWPNCECRDLRPVSVGWPNCREFRRDVLVGARWELRWRACSGRFSCSNVWRCPSCHRSFRTAVIFSAERAPRRGTVSIVQAGSTAVVLRNAIVRVQCVTSC